MGSGHPPDPSLHSREPIISKLDGKLVPQLKQGRGLCGVAEKALDPEQEAGVSPGMLHTSCVTLDKLLRLSEPWVE